MLFSFKPLLFSWVQLSYFPPTSKYLSFQKLNNFFFLFFLLFTFLLHTYHTSRPLLQGFAFLSAILPYLCIFFFFLYLVGLLSKRAKWSHLSYFLLLSPSSSFCTPLFKLFQITPRDLSTFFSPLKSNKTSVFSCFLQQLRPISTECNTWCVNVLFNCPALDLFM